MHLSSSISLLLLSSSPSSSYGEAWRRLWRRCKGRCGGGFGGVGADALERRHRPSTRFAQRAQLGVAESALVVDAAVTSETKSAAVVADSDGEAVPVKCETAAAASP